MIEIKSARFVTSVVDVSAFSNLPAHPQFVMVGRSNVGKSSLINTLARRKGMARVGATPGVTRLINVYEINECIHLVDLPGFGFASVDAKEKQRWAVMIEGYLHGSERIAGALQLVDIRREPSPQDAQMTAWLRHYGLPMITVATKADKSPRSQRQKLISSICRALVVQPWEVVAFSAEDATGRDDILKWMTERVVSDGASPPT